jgi:hypothetical protein
MKKDKTGISGGGRRLAGARYFPEPLLRRILDAEAMRGVKVLYVPGAERLGVAVGRLAGEHPKTRLLLAAGEASEEAALREARKGHANIEIVEPFDPRDPRSIPGAFDLAFINLPADDRADGIPSSSAAGRHLDAFVIEQLLGRMRPGARLKAVLRASLLFAQSLQRWRERLVREFTIVSIGGITRAFWCPAAVNAAIVEIAKRPPRTGWKIRVHEHPPERDGRGPRAAERSAEVEQGDLAHMAAWSTDTLLADEGADVRVYLRSDVSKAPLETVIESIFSGIYPKPEERCKDREGATHAMAAIGDIRDSRLVLDAPAWLKILNRRRSAPYEIRPGDLLLTARGSALKMAVVKDLPFPAVIGNNLICIRTGQTYDPDLLRVFLESPVGLRMLESRTRTLGLLMAISPKDLLNIPAPVPPMAEQRRLAERAERAESEARRVIAQAERRREEAMAEVYGKLGIRKA